MNKYSARYQNALKWANKINDLLNRGYKIFDEDMNPVKEFIVNDNGDISQKINDNVYSTFFVNNIRLDNGYHTSIQEYNKQFEDWVYIHPDHIKKFKV